MAGPNCKCGSPSMCLEVKKEGPTRGRWFWKCAASQCRFFQWDDSAMPFIRHPSEVYALAGGAGWTKRPQSLPMMYKKSEDKVLPPANVKIKFSIISKQHIALKADSNLTTNPVIASIDEIEWDEEHDRWLLPANLRAYDNALKTLPTKVPNINLEVVPIPSSLLELMTPEEAPDNPDQCSEVELKWLEFIESPTRDQLFDFQQKAVKFGIERRGRVILGNEHGVGITNEALALANVYMDEGPVLLLCPEVLCHTWRENIQKFLGLDEEEVCLLDDIEYGLFKQQPTTPKRKAKSTVSKERPSKKRFQASYQMKMKKRMANKSGENDESSSSSSSDSEEEANEQVPKKPVRYYICSHKKASNNRAKIAHQQFKVVICDAAHYLKSKEQNQARNLCAMLRNANRAILLSDTALYSLPIDLFTLINAVDSQWVPDLEVYTQRYCDPRNTVFGWTMNGRSNTEEFAYFMETKIWYCPTLLDMKPEIPNIIRDVVVLKIDKKLRKLHHPHLLELHPEETDFDKYVDENNLIKLANEAKREPICEYIDYVFTTYKRPKIAIAYFDTDTIKAIEEYLGKKKIKSNHLNNLQNLETDVHNYNNSLSVQVALLDMSTEDVDICLNSVDLAIIVDLPRTKQKLLEVENYFESSDRKTTCTIRYLVAPETIDTYLWPMISE